MKRKEIRICKVCGKEIDKYGSYKFGMCCKHYTQFRKYGRCLDNNPRTVYDPNEIRTVDGYGEIDTYNNLPEIASPICYMEHTPFSKLFNEFIK